MQLRRPIDGRIHVRQIVAREEELQARIKVLTTALEPMIIVLLGGFVGFIAVSIILPMFKLSSTVH